MQKEDIMSSRPRPQASVMRGSRMRNIVIISVFSGVLFLIYLLSDANQKWSNYQYEAEKCQQRRDSLSAQLQVTFEHKGRLDKALQEERSQHAKSREEFMSYKQMQQNAREKDQETSLKRLEALRQQGTELQNQNEDLRGENNQVNKKNEQLLNEARQIESDFRAQIQQKDLKMKTIIDQVQTMNIERTQLINKITDLKLALKKVLSERQAAIQSKKTEVAGVLETNKTDAENKVSEHGNAQPGDDTGENDEQKPEGDQKLNAMQGLKNENADDVRDSYIQNLAQSANSVQKPNAANVQSNKISELNEIQGNANEGLGNAAALRKPVEDILPNKMNTPPSANAPVNFAGQQNQINNIAMNGLNKNMPENVMNQQLIPPKFGSKDQMEGLPNLQQQHPVKFDNAVRESEYNAHVNGLNGEQNEDIFIKKGDAEDKMRLPQNEQIDHPNLLKEEEHDEGEYDDQDDKQNKNGDEEYQNKEPEDIQAERYKKFRDWNQRQIDQEQNGDINNQEIVRRQNGNLEDKEAEDVNGEVDGVMVAPH